jgi:hypothetical protein
MWSADEPRYPRVHDYYQTLIHEHRQWLEKKSSHPEKEKTVQNRSRERERKAKYKIDRRSAELSSSRSHSFALNDELTVAFRERRKEEAISSVIQPHIKILDLL